MEYTVERKANPYFRVMEKVTHYLENDVLEDKENQIRSQQELIKYINQISYYYLNNPIIKYKYDIISREIKNMSYVLNNHLNKYFSKSSTLYHHHFRSGDICCFYFGVNIVPEMSLDHMGIVIGTTKDYLYVLPICTKKARHQNAYHPIDNDGNTIECDKSLYVMKKDEFDFLNHDSVLNVTDLRCVSRKRAFKYLTTLDTKSDFFQEIMKKSFYTIYPTISYKNDLRIERMNEKFIQLLNDELIESKIILSVGDEFDIHDYMRGIYGKLVNESEIQVDMSQSGEYTNTLIFEDEFENLVEKEFIVRVVERKVIEN